MSVDVPSARWRLAVAFAVFGAATWLACSGKADAVDGHAPAIAWMHITDTPDAEARFDAALASAKRQGRPVVIDFFADGCLGCKRLDELTYAKEAVQKDARRFVAIKVDTTHESAALEAIQTRFGVVGLPTVAFVDGHGVITTEPRITGFVDAATFLQLAQEVR